MRYSPNLDGIRALAALIVLGFHARLPFLSGGWVGVDVFFVMSGYLITRLLLNETQQTGRVSVAAFYGRRLARLYPTLLVVAATCALLAPRLWPNINGALDSALSLLYLTDYSHLWHDAPSPLTHTWSLSVEEHFYLLWPLLLPCVLRCRKPALVLLFAYLALTAWRLISFHRFGWEATYYRFDTRLTGLVLGCLLPFVQLPTRKIVPIAWAAITLVAVGVTYGRPYALGAPMVLAELAAAVIVLAAVHSPGGVLGSAPLAYLGRLSYGIYLWHLPVLWVVDDGQSSYWLFAVAVPASCALAAVTYHAIDVPIRRWRRNLGAPSYATPS